VTPVRRGGPAARSHGGRDRAPGSPPRRFRRGAQRRGGRAGGAGFESHLPHL